VWQQANKGAGFMMSEDEAQRMQRKARFDKSGWRGRKVGTLEAHDGFDLSTAKAIVVRTGKSVDQLVCMVESKSSSWPFGWLPDSPAMATFPGPHHFTVLARGGL
jgi:hypothetical protein